MEIDYVHFYVEDARVWRNWFVHTLGCQPLAAGSSWHTHTETVGTGSIYFVLSSALDDRSPVAQYLRLHPPGVVDLAFRVSNLAAALDRAIAQGAKQLQPLQTKLAADRVLSWAQVAGWGVNHTLVEGSGFALLLPGFAVDASAPTPGSSDAEIVTAAPVANCYEQVTLIGIDHAVLNVAVGDLEQAVRWYEKTLGFERQQSFAIQTQHSALCSQVLTHPEGTAQLPINEPASASSQIQEFLDANRGAGIQHLALQVANIVQTIAHLRQTGLSFLHVPPTYYRQLRQRPGFELSESTWQTIAQQEVLVDWREELPKAMLLQAFTQPIFGQPTFFFELIERQSYWINQRYQQAQGFGEGNFQALFEAIEREQMQRGSLF
jgi:4-hydroxyphenylpyruvate dioxygenase